VTVPREALETELAGVEARLARADDAQRAKLENRIAHIREQLGIPAPAPKTKRAAGGKETRPEAPGVEVTGG
jgi:hypothetical protein